MRRILHIDMDAFFAAVEEKRRPELKGGKPVVIGGGGDPTKRGVVSTANYEARKFGIHSSMPLRTAYKLCPQAVFLPVDMEEYARVSAKIKNILSGFSPVMEDVGIDEAFLDISDNPAASEDISKKIKQAIYTVTGLTSSIGIGSNKLIAKIASDFRKPDGLTIVENSGIKEFLSPLPVRKLYGVGPKTEALLKEMGINTVGGLAAKNLDELIEGFGHSYGKYLYDASRGIDESPLVTEWEPKSISRETTFQKDTDNWQVIAKTLAELTRDVVEDMKAGGYKSRSVTVKIRFSDFKTQTRAKSLDEASESLEEIRKAAFSALSRFEDLKPPIRGKGVRLVGVKAGRLATGG